MIEELCWCERPWCDNWLSGRTGGCRKDCGVPPDVVVKKYFQNELDALDEEQLSQGRQGQ